MMGPTLGTGVRTGELGELPAQENGQLRPRPITSPSASCLVWQSSFLDARACVYTCVCRCTRRWAHTTRPWPLQSRAWPPFQCGPGLDPQGSSEQDSQAAQGSGSWVSVAWPAMGRPTEGQPTSLQNNPSVKCCCWLPSGHGPEPPPHH